MVAIVAVCFLICCFISFDFGRCRGQKIPVKIPQRYFDPHDAVVMMEDGVAYRAHFPTEEAAAAWCRRFTSVVTRLGAQDVVKATAVPMLLALAQAPCDPEACAAEIVEGTRRFRKRRSA